MGCLRSPQPKPNNGGENKMDFKTRYAIIKSLQYNLRNKDSKVILPNEMYAEALEL